VIEARSDCDLFAEIAAEQDRGDAVIGQVQRPQNLDRIVGRAIVNEDDLEASRIHVENRHESLQKRPDVLGFVQDRNNDAQFRLPIRAAMEHRAL
jgi:hypothetical protein